VVAQWPAGVLGIGEGSMRAMVCCGVVGSWEVHCERDETNCQD
jgi:hypothetical protein